MTSLLTNTSAISAVANLTATQRSLATVQNQISTGLRVSSAADNAAYWSIATHLNTQIGNLKAVNDTLDLNKSLLQVTMAGLTNILVYVNAIAKDVQQAKQSGIDLNVLQQDIAQSQTAIINASKDASFNGQNLLDNNWTLKEATTETSVQNGSTFVSGTGKDLYTLTSDQGQTETVEDDFTMNADGTRTYTTVGTTSNDPVNNLRIPISIGQGGASVLTSDLGLGGINIVGNSSVNGISSLNAYLDQSTGTYYKSVPVTNTITDIHGSTPVTYTSTSNDYAEMGRGGSAGVVASSQPWNDYRADIASASVATHTYTAPSGAAAPGTYYYPVPYETGSGGDPNASSTSYDYYYSQGGSPSPLTASSQGQTITVSPYQDLLNFSLTGEKRVSVDGTPNTPYVLNESDLSAVFAMVNTNIAYVTNALSTVGSATTALDASKTFNTSLINALTTSVGSLVDADMNADSTRLSALQTQESLGIQSLSIANDNTKSLLKLFATG